jgi:ACR3 family arsenite efflux pump ArsB
MPNLINDILIKSGALQNIVNSNTQVWFDNVNVKDLFIVVIIPLFIAVFTAFMLKSRYDERVRRRKFLYRNLRSADFEDSENS